MAQTASDHNPIVSPSRTGAGIKLAQYYGDDSYVPPPVPTLPEINQHTQPRTHRCSVALIFLMDESGSIPGDKWRLQWAATADALMHPTVLDSIQAVKGIAVMVRSFDSVSRTRTAWHVLETPADVARFATLLKGQHHQYDGGTEIGQAVTESMPYFEVSPCKEARNVIDVSTDGESSKVTMEAAREVAHQREITVNGIAVDGISATADVAYEGLKNHQVTRDGMVWKSDWTDYGRMLRLKILQEIADAGGLKLDEQGRIIPHKTKAAGHDFELQDVPAFPSQLEPLRSIIPTRAQDTHER